MTVHFTVISVSIVFAVAAFVLAVSRSWVRAGSDIDRIIAEVTTPERELIQAPALHSSAR